MSEKSAARVALLFVRLQPALPYLALALGILITSMSAIFVKWADAPAAVNGFYRMTIAGVVFALPYRRVSQQQKPLMARQWMLVTLAGIFFALNLTAWNTGALIGSAANVTLIGNLSVIWVPLAAIVLFHQRLRPLFWGGLVIALSGVVVILGQDLIAHPTIGAGDLMALLASGFYSVYLLATERMRRDVNALVAWWLSTVLSAVALLLISVILGQPLSGYSVQTYAIFFLMALLVQGAGFLSLSFALGHLPASLVSPSMLAQPVVTAFLAIPLLGQSISAAQIVGGTLTLLGILVVHRSKQR